MANVVLNKLTIFGESEQLTKIEELFKNDEGEFEFSLDKIIQEPSELSNGDLCYDLDLIDKYRRGVGDIDIKTISERLKSGNSIDELNKIYDDFIAKYGTVSWYDWRIAKWGCKWDVDLLSMEYIDGDMVIMFETPWDCPYYAIKELSNQYPECCLQLDYADEDLGTNCGWYVFDKGLGTSEGEMDYDEAKEFWGVDDEGDEFYE